MQENTKVWLVILKAGHWGTHGINHRIIGAFLSKEEAQFYAWSMNQQENSSNNSMFYSTWDVEESFLMVIEKNSVKYKKFLERHLEETETELNELTGKEEQIVVKKGELLARKQEIIKKISTK